MLRSIQKMTRRNLLHAFAFYPKHSSRSLYVLCCMTCLFFAHSAVGANTQDKYNIEMIDGSRFVGTFTTKQISVKTTYGAMNITLTKLVQYEGNTFEMTDGSIIKGNAQDASVSIVTNQGNLTLALDDIKRISVASKVPNQNPIKNNSAIIAGRVIDNFGNPLLGATVSIANTRFTATTDDTGSYQISYVPGKILVQYHKEDHHSTDFATEIHERTVYPAKDIVLFRRPPGKGLFVMANGKYTKIPKAELKVDNINLGNSASGKSSEARFRAVGKPTIIRQTESVNVYDNDGRSQTLYKSNAQGKFYVREMYGIGMRFEHRCEEVKESFTRAPDKSNIRNSKLLPGYYVFATGKGPEAMNLESPITQPVYFIHVIAEETEEADNGDTTKDNHDNERQELPQADTSMSRVKLDASDYIFILPVGTRRQYSIEYTSPKGTTFPAKSSLTFDKQVKIGEHTYSKSTYITKGIGKTTRQVFYNRLSSDGIYTMIASGDNKTEYLTTPIPLSVGDSWTVNTANGKAQYHAASLESVVINGKTYNNCLKIITQIANGENETYIAPKVGEVKTVFRWPNGAVMTTSLLN